jgi:hypothetical protein
MKGKVASSPPIEEMVEEATAVYQGRWNLLVSTTNWEKGRIIAEWRQALIDGGAKAAEFTDDAWSRRVGNVSSQHVGRLRRVHERFAAVRDTYPGLYWSHFQAALDWHDAEMWLEGALRSGWSIAEMREERWQALGAVESERPRAGEIVTADYDEDAPAVAEAQAPAARAEAPNQDAAESDDGDWHADGDEAELGIAFDPDAPVAHADRPEPFRPFADLPDLPDDLADACESFKLAIVRHKLAGWVEVARDDVLATLAALKALAMSEAQG